MAYRALGICALAAVVAAGCSSSDGGAKHGGSSGATPGSANAASGGDAGTQPAANGNKAPAGGATPAAKGKGGTTTTGSNDAAANSGGGVAHAGDGSGAALKDPTDDDICQFLKAQTWADKTSAEIAYLCDQGGLAKLRANPDGRMNSIVDRQDGSISRFTFAGAIAAAGTLANAEKQGDVFCTSFDQYKALIGSAPFDQVESITPSNKTKEGCDFEFKAKAILFFQASYKGHVSGAANQAGTIAVSANYLTQQESLIQESVSISLVAKVGDKLLAVTVQTSASDTKGFHDQARDGIVAGFQAGFQGFVNALSKG